MVSLLFIIGLITFGFALVSAKFDNSVITPPMIFTGTGVLIAVTIGDLLPSEQASRTLESVAELTLVIVLFIDATRIRLPLLVSDYQIPLRLLGIGLPLTVLLGAIIAKVVFTEFSIWEAALLAAILAPTDAALGQAVASSPKIPLKIRQSLNVESGLNDGIVLPLVMLFAAITSAGDEPGGQTSWLSYWIHQVTLGPLVGILGGAVGGIALAHAKRIGCLNANFERLSGVALALLAWSGAILIGGNGFIAAFVAGLSISCFADNIGDSLRDFGESEGQLFALATFLLFGMIIVLPAIQSAAVNVVLYALLSLTIIRMLPVAISLAGLTLHRPTILFLSWFGPRGLASLLFSLLVISTFDVAHGSQIMNIVTITVLMSIVAHGLSAVPAAGWYASCVQKVATPDSMEHEPAAAHRPKFTFKSG